MTGLGSSCGACKFLRRKCNNGCLFAPYFCYDQGATHFAAIHKVFGASNVSKLLSHLPVHDRGEAAITISYEAQARVRDPIYGCVAHIFALQQQVISLQEEIDFLTNQVSRGFAGNTINPRNLEAINNLNICEFSSKQVGANLSNFLDPNVPYPSQNSNQDLNYEMNLQLPPLNRESMSGWDQIMVGEPNYMENPAFSGGDQEIMTNVPWLDSAMYNEYTKLDPIFH